MIETYYIIKAYREKFKKSATYFYSLYNLLIKTEKIDRHEFF